MLAEFRFAELSEPVLKEALVALDGCRNRLDATVVHTLGVFDARSMWAGDGDRSTAGWVAARTEAAKGQHLVRCAWVGPCARCPQPTRRSRPVSWVPRRSALLADAAKHAPEVFASDEAGLIDKAMGLRVDQAKVMVEFWKDHANPDDEVDEHERQFQARSVFLSQTLDGMWRLDGSAARGDG